MSNVPKKKPDQTPESFSPKKPEIANLMETLSSERVLEKLYSGEITEYFEVIKHDGYRFIGKTAYARAFGLSDNVFAGMWHYFDWIDRELDKLSEHASDDTNNAALMTWDLFFGGERENQGVKFNTALLGYCVGRYMKPDCPVPQDMDYIDIPPGYIGKWIGNHDDYPEMMVREKIEETGLFKPTSWIWMAEVFPKQREGGKKFDGFYVSCVPTSEEERKAAQARAKINNLLKENPDKGLAELQQLHADDPDTLAAIQVMHDDIIRQKNDEIRQSSYPPSVSQFEVYNTTATSIETARNSENFARSEGASPIAINSVPERSQNLTSGNTDAGDDSTRWSAKMDDGLLDNAEPDWMNTKNVWFGADLGAVTSVNSVIVTETAAIGFGADNRRTLGDWVIEVATDIAEPNENRTLSTDGWTVVASGSGIGQGLAKLISFPATEAKFVRMRTVNTK